MSEDATLEVNANLKPKPTKATSSKSARSPRRAELSPKGPTRKETDTLNMTKASSLFPDHIQMNILTKAESLISGAGANFDSF